MIGDRQAEWLEAAGDKAAQAKIARQIHVDVISRVVLYLVIEVGKHSVISLFTRWGR